MKAAILKGYDKNGSNLELRDIPVPEISEKEVLVKIRTAGVNPLDNMIVHGEVKLIVPYSFPLVMGNEFVGIIEKQEAVSKALQQGIVYMEECRLRRSERLRNMPQLMLRQSPRCRSIFPMKKRPVFR